MKKSPKEDDEDRKNPNQSIPHVNKVLLEHLYDASGLFLRIESPLSDVFWCQKVRDQKHFFQGYNLLRTIPLRLQGNYSKLFEKPDYSTFLAKFRFQKHMSNIRTYLRFTYFLDLPTKNGAIVATINVNL